MITAEPGYGFSMNSKLQLPAVKMGLNRFKITGNADKTLNSSFLIIKCFYKSVKQLKCKNDISKSKGCFQNR